jgi:predicted small secreted protein
MAVRFFVRRSGTHRRNLFPAHAFLLQEWRSTRRKTVLEGEVTMLQTIRNLTVPIFLLAGALGLAACETVEGAGRDIENAGESIQDAAE